MTQKEGSGVLGEVVIDSIQTDAPVAQPEKPVSRYKDKRNKQKRKFEKEERLEKVIQVSRVTKVVKGGKRLRFRATIVIGDKDGSVGVGIGKSTEVPSAIQKGIAKAKKDIVKCHLNGGTVPHEVVGRCGSSKVLLRPAPPGTGVIAGGSVRTVLEYIGISDIVSKSLGSANIINVAKATVNALSSLFDFKAVSSLRGKKFNVKNYNMVNSKSIAVDADRKPNTLIKVVTPEKNISNRKSKKSLTRIAEENKLSALVSDSQVASSIGGDVKDA